MEVETVNGPEYSAARHAELEHEQFSSRSEGGKQPCQTAGNILEITHAESHRRRIERFAAVSGRLGVALHELYTLRQRLPFHFRPSYGQHPFRQIDADDSRPGAGLGQHDRQIGRAGGHVQHRAGMLRPDRPHDPAAPAPVDAQRKQVIQQIVATGYPVEHRPHLLFLPVRIVIRLHRIAFIRTGCFSPAG